MIFSCSKYRRTNFPIERSAAGIQYKEQNKNVECSQFPSRVYLNNITCTMSHVNLFSLTFLCLLTCFSRVGTSETSSSSVLRVLDGLSSLRLLRGRAAVLASGEDEGVLETVAEWAAGRSDVILCLIRKTGDCKVTSRHECIYFIIFCKMAFFRISQWSCSTSKKEKCSGV